MGSPNVVVADMDCSGNAQSTCGSYGVQGYPTLKMIADGKTVDYNGARSFDGMKREIESKEACAKDDLEVLEMSEKLSKAERVAKIKEVEQEIKDAKKEASDLEKKAKKLAADLDLIKAGGQTVEKVEQLLNDADWRAHCDG